MNFGIIQRNLKIKKQKLSMCLEAQILTNFPLGDSKELPLVQTLHYKKVENFLASKQFLSECTHEG